YDLYGPALLLSPLTCIHHQICIFIVSTASAARHVYKEHPSPLAPGLPSSPIHPTLEHHPDLPNHPSPNQVDCFPHLLTNTHIHKDLSPLPGMVHQMFFKALATRQEKNKRDL
uniref:Uncharacterized protein n=1 Tax=Romanomermis culicivorax TaxID=13658 RepID=A0A915HR77_ROMCU